MGRNDRTIAAAIARQQKADARRAAAREAREDRRLERQARIWTRKTGRR